LILLACREPEAERDRDDLFAKDIAARHCNRSPGHDQ
jgi:hypothetical protein